MGTWGESEGSTTRLRLFFNFCTSVVLCEVALTRVPCACLMCCLERLTHTALVVPSSHPLAPLTVPLPALIHLQAILSVSQPLKAVFFMPSPFHYSHCQPADRSASLFPSGLVLSDRLH
jgi:hypothetical protein